MASMETAPAVRQAAQAPATPKRIVAQATSGSGAYSNSGVRSGLLDGMKNNRMQTASVVSASVMASAARLTEIGRCPLRSRSAQCTISGTSVTTAKVLVTVRATTVSHISLEMPDNLKRRRHDDAGQRRRQQAAEQHQREAQCARGRSDVDWE